ncbi:COG1470 family protein [Streptomyces sp. PTD5-9]|uniref:COG1470 family protein n=1 Tax=Streptomyces sp. PTD5-9 TaxID=3120150 RepID=UPI0030093D85
MPPPTGHPVRLALAVLLLTLAMTPAAGAEPRTPAPSPGAAAWTARPVASGSGKDGDRPYFYLEGPPGAVLQDRLAVTNPGAAPVTVRLRGGDADRAEGDGRPERGGAAAPGNGAGAWLRTAAARVTVPARTRAEVPFSVTVPADAVPGDHPGAIVVESGGRSVDVRIRLRVGGPALAALTVEDVAVSGRTIRYTLVNRGNTVLAPKLAVEADGVFGALLRRGARPLPVELAPGERAALTEPWRDAPALDAATVRLRVTADGGAHGEATARAAFVPRAPLLGGALLLTAAAAAGYAYRRRRARGRAAGAEAPPGRGDGPPARPPGPEGGGRPAGAGAEKEHMARTGGAS